MSSSQTPGGPPGPTDDVPGGEKVENVQTSDSTRPVGGLSESPPKKWYIVHTYSGQEARAKQSLLERATALGHESAIDEVLIPEENVVEI